MTVRMMECFKTKCTGAGIYIECLDYSIEAVAFSIVALLPQEHSKVFDYSCKRGCEVPCTIISACPPDDGKNISSRNYQK